jgi:hypothetical protein
MKKLILTLIVIFLLTPTIIFAGQDKISICHLPPGNPSNGHVISIPLAQWEGSGGHSTGGHGGDYEGECQNPTETPTPTTASPTPTGELEPTPTSDPNASPTPEPTPTDVPEPTPTTASPTPTGEPEPTPTSEPNATPSPEPTPTDNPEPTVESEVQSTIDQIIALIEKLVDFVQNL